MQHYNKLIADSNNKVRTTWDIIRTVTNNSKNNLAISLINSDGKLCSSNQIITSTFNNLEWTTPDSRNTPSNINLKEEEIVGALRNDGNESMLEEVERPNP